MNPLVSVLTPTCDPARLPTLRRAVRSIFRQTYSHVEAIVIADGSQAIHVDALAKEIRDPRLRVAHLETPQGPAVARNAGAEVAQGEYLAFLDDDDEWLPQKLDVQMEVIREHPEAAFVFSDAHVIQETGATTFFKIANFSGPPTLEALCRNDFVLCVTAVVKRTIFDEVGGLDPAEELLGTDDADLWGRILHRSYTAAYSPLPLAIHNHHKNSYSDGLEFLQHLANLLKKRMRLFSDRPECVALLKDYLFRITWGQASKLLCAGRIEESAACFQRASSLRPSSAGGYTGAFYEGAYRCLLLGRNSEARQFLRYSMRFKPFHWKNYIYWIFTYLPPFAYKAARKLKRTLLQDP